MTELEAPANSSVLYMARGDEVEPLRPLLQGDVLDGIEIPGLDDGVGLATILAHPCAMRTAGGALRPRIAMARVRPYEGIPFDSWPKGHYRVLPLPDLRPQLPQERVAADFEMSGPVRTTNLAASPRIACLSEYGIAVLQQRLVHHETRVVIELPVLDEQSAPNIEEAALLEEWLVSLVQNPNDANEVAELTGRFNDYLDSAGNQLRRALREPLKRAGVRRQIMQEIEHIQPKTSPTP